MTTEKKGLFETLYAAGKDVLDSINKPLIRKELKRKLESGYDDASKRIGKAEKELSKARSAEDFEKYDLNTILKYRQEITDCKQIQTIIKEEYLELFGTEMKTEDED